MLGHQQAQCWLHFEIQIHLFFDYLLFRMCWLAGRHHSQRLTISLACPRVTWSVKHHATACVMISGLMHSFIFLIPLKTFWYRVNHCHYNDVIMTTIASQITSLTVVYSTVYSDVDQSKHQSSASLAIVWWIHRGPVNSPHKWPVTRKMFPFDDVIMVLCLCNT